MTNYTGTKLARRDDPATGEVFVPTGATYSGTAYVVNEARTELEAVENMTPVIGYSLAVSNGISWLKTSAVTNYYIHGDESGNTPDVLVLPSWLPKDISHNMVLEEGDVVVQTMNSFYLFRPIKH